MSIYTPTFIKDLFVYDVLHNDFDNLIVITPNLDTNKINTIKYRDEQFDEIVCPHKHTRIFKLNRKLLYEKHICLQFDNTFINLKVNKYPEFKNELVYSTMVHHEDAYIIQWIEFHKNIGINRFIIYDNAYINDSMSYTSKENSSNLEALLEEYIKKEIVVLIKWPYPKRLERYRKICGQTTQQNHSIYAFQNASYIGFFDIDEYLNLQKKSNFNDFLQSQNIDKSNIGGIRIPSKRFYNSDNQDDSNYNFLKIYNCDSECYIKFGKCFIIPVNVNTMSIHTITSGKKLLNIDDKEVFFNHYFYLNKAKRGLNKTNYIDDSIKKHCHFITF